MSSFFISNAIFKAKQCFIIMNCQQVMKKRTLSYKSMNALGNFIRRFFDILISVICLIVFSPVFLICYIAIKAEDGGNTIFKQERIGKDGKPFQIYKFRSMGMEAEKNGPVLCQDEEDNRLTKTGRFLRAQDMAFVGPRPERKFFIDKIMEHDERYEQLYQVRPGVTSYATLYNGYTSTMEKMLKRLELDLYYMEHRSLWMDFLILAKTFFSIVFGKKF